MIAKTEEKEGDSFVKGYHVHTSKIFYYVSDVLK